MPILMSISCAVCMLFFALRPDISLYRETVVFHNTVNTRLDLPTFQDPIVKAKVAQLAPKDNEGQAWSVFSGLVNVLSVGIGILSELYVLFSLFRGEENGRLFVGLAAVRPVLDVFNLSGRWPQSTVDLFLITARILLIEPSFLHLREK